MPKDKKEYKANWLVQGLTKKPLNAGDTVELDPEVAQPFVDGGSLSPVSPETDNGGNQDGGTQQVSE